MANMSKRMAMKGVGKRHLTAPRAAITLEKAINRARVRKLAERGGVGRFCRNAVPTLRVVMHESLLRVVGRAQNLAKLRGAHTITAAAVRIAFLQEGLTLVGGGD